MLDNLVLDQLEMRILESERLQMLLARVLEASSESKIEKAKELAMARSSRTKAETALGNLIDLVEVGEFSPRDPVFGKRLADRKTEIERLSLVIADLERQCRSSQPILDEAAVAAFAKLLRAKLRDPDPQLRQFYVRALIADIRVNTDGITIRGSKNALEHAALNPKRIAWGRVPGFDREWCPGKDSNLHGLAATGT